MYVDFSEKEENENDEKNKLKPILGGLRPERPGTYIDKKTGEEMVLVCGGPSYPTWVHTMKF